MDFEFRPSRPVVKSYSSAEAEFQRWLHENHFQYVLDAEGTAWTVVLDLEQAPAEGDLKRMDFCLQVSLEATTNAEKLMNSGVLDAEVDSRLLNLLGTDQVAMKMRPMVYQADTEQAARNLLIQVLPRLRDDMAKTNLTEMKRALVGRHIDQSSLFGQSQINKNVLKCLKDSDNETV
jgi:hypothetical protein